MRSAVEELLSIILNFIIKDIEIGTFSGLNAHWTLDAIADAFAAVRAAADQLY